MSAPNYGTYITAVLEAQTLWATTLHNLNLATVAKADAQAQYDAALAGLAAAKQALLDILAPMIPPP